MSDLSIPGLGGGKNSTKELVETLMKRERIPLDRMTAELERSKTQKQVWQDVNTNLSQVRDSAALLFSFQNPFNQKVASSTNDKVLTATATREAIDETRQITVRRLATADRLLSRPIDRAFRVEAGRYSFRIGDKDVAFSFSGGTVTDFVEAVNKRAPGELKASLLKDTKDTQVLLLESRLTGAANSLQLGDKARDLALAVGMVEPGDSRSFSASLGAAASSAAGPSAAAPGELSVAPGGRATVPISPPFAVQPNIVLEMEIKTTSLERTPWEPPAPPPGPDLPEGAVVSFSGIEIRSAASRMPIPAYAAPQAPEVVEDMNVLSLESSGRVVPLPEVALSSQWRTYKVSLADIADSVSAVNIQNRNTYREVAVRGLRIYDSTSRGDTRPLNALSEARDAELTVDGVSITRDSNTIADLIPGVTLTLKSASEDPVQLEVTPDVATIKEKIIAFVGRYNQSLTDIDVLTRRDESVIEQAYYQTDEERTKAKERLGLFAGDMTLSRLKSQLTSLMMNSYTTSAGEAMALLAQIGIATNTAVAAGGIDRTRLRGYLDIDEAKLDSAIRSKTKDVQQLFGFDTDGDLVIDSGVAFEVDRTLRAYVGRGGIIAQRTGTLDTEITGQNARIARENERLVDTEAELKRKYTAMEGALQSLEQSSSRLDSFNQSKQ